MKSLFVLSAVFCAAVLSACVFSRGISEPIRSYVLEMENGQDALGLNKPRSKSLPGLLLSIPQPAPGFESQGMIYEQVPHELRSFATSQWIDSPARMLVPLLTKSLEASETWGSVVLLPSMVRGDFRLDISQVALVQDFTQQPSHIRLTLRAQLMTVVDPRVIGTREFEFQEKASSEDAYGGVLAAQQAVSRFLMNLNDWLAGCLSGSPKSPC
ncbi:MAG: ABC-type transport auxiliary lipoprotein family protein [Nitrospirales bacterium]